MEINTDEGKVVKYQEECLKKSQGNRILILSTSNYNASKSVDKYTYIP